jgi:ArsR family transcriptional regulator
MDAKAMDIMKAKAEIFKALGHPARLLMVEELSRGTRCVCELQRLVGSDISTVSKHLKILRRLRIVETEKSGTQVFYRLRLGCFTTFNSCVEKFLQQRFQMEIGKKEDL